MNNSIKHQVKKILSREKRLFYKDILSKVFDIYSLRSYSQEGEDMILRRIFEYVDRGFYLDVGANHPQRFSNTYFFYQKGWSGINIDATPGSMKRFNSLRPRDINIEAAIAKEEQEMTFYLFDDPALNTFDNELAQQRIDNTTYQLIDKQQIKTYKVSQILDRYLPNNVQIDFMSIDIEGLDLDTLESNNWEKCVPKVILIEQSNFDFNNQDNYPICTFLKSKGYSFFAKTLNTLFFTHSSYIRIKHG